VPAAVCREGWPAELWGSSIVHMPLPDFDELLAWIAGEGSALPLSEEEKARIRESEMVRAQAQREVAQAMASGAGGPVVGTCGSCGKPLRANWRLRTFRGAPSAAACPRCHHVRPQEAGAQLCPGCGGRLWGWGPRAATPDLRPGHGLTGDWLGQAALGETEGGRGGDAPRRPP
jgi:hypothetical protein